jgi:hypothetical protein
MKDVSRAHLGEDRLSAFRAGRLSAADASTVARHLAACPACRAKLDVLAGPTMDEPPHGFTLPAPEARPPGPTPVAPPGQGRGSMTAPHDPVAPAERGIPEQFGRYRILKPLGKGGMGSVYLAHDTQLDRRVALKVPRFTERDGPRLLERFYREARAAATLEHANLCPVYDVGQIDGIHYLTMGFIEGRPLSDFIQADRPLGQRQCAAVVRKLALALAQAHARGVIHRDLKPANIMISSRKEPVIMDFGLARRASQQEEVRLTHEGVVMGTPAYMPPEQVKGEVEAMGPACDIYSLGVILYQLLTGRLPFEGPTMAVLACILTQEPAPPSTRRPDLDRALEAICLKAMAKKPEDRFASMSDLAGALTEYLKGQTQRASVSPAKLPMDPDETKKGSEEGLALQLFADMVDPQPARASAPAVQKKAAAPPRRQLAIWAVGAAALAIALGVVILIQTQSGTIKIELVGAAKGVEVQVDGDAVEITGLEEPLRLRAGKHFLQVTGKNFESVSQSFTVRRGANPVLRVELVPRAVARAETPAPPVVKPAEPPEVPPQPTPQPKPESPVPSAVRTTPPQPQPPPDAATLAFFNGKDLQGWEGLEQYWRVEDGAIVGRSPASLSFNTFLCSKKKYRDFDLRFKVRLLGEDANSGVQIRSEVLDRSKFTVRGPQGDMGGTYWGSLYGELFGGMMTQAPEDVVNRVLNKGGFNDYAIRCVGRHVTIKLNGEVTVDEDFPTLPPEGVIAWQLHGRVANDVTFKDVHFVDLGQPPAASFRDLFNGQDLSNWMKRDGQPAAWTVGQGHVEVVPRQGDIRTRETFGPDFELHAEFWVPLMPQARGQGRGNSGIFLQGRYEVQILDSYPRGIDPRTDCGALFGLIAVSKNACKPPGQWQTFDITFHAPRVNAQGQVRRKGRLTVVQNGEMIIREGEFDQTTGPALDNNLGDPGPILLQDHGCRVRFRNLRIRPLPPDE